jgi:hypothetical protein
MQVTLEREALRAYDASPQTDFWFEAARFLECIDIAPTTCARIESMLDRAYLAAEVGQTVIQKEEMFRAGRLAKSVDWNAVVGEEAKVLLSLAATFSREDASLARRWLSKFDRTRAIPKPTLSLATDDRRQTAMEMDAEGAVLRAEGRDAEALAAWRSALTIWDAPEHGWRAARTALEIAGTTRSPGDIAATQTRMRNFRKSWLRRKARAVAS